MSEPVIDSLASKDSNQVVVPVIKADGDRHEIYEASLCHVW